jgi:Ca-activated chloride channel family protein
MLPLEFTRPWILLAILPMAAIVAWFFLRSLSDFPKPQRVVSMVVRLTMLAFGVNLAS